VCVCVRANLRTILSPVARCCVSGKDCRVSIHDSFLFFHLCVCMVWVGTQRKRWNRCRVLQCVAVCCNCVCVWCGWVVSEGGAIAAVCCSVLQCVAVCRSCVCVWCGWVVSETGGRKALLNTSYPIYTYQKSLLNMQLSEVSLEYTSLLNRCSYSRETLRLVWSCTPASPVCVYGVGG